MNSAKIYGVDDGVIVNSMKKVFEEEIDEIKQELDALYKKYNVRNVGELQLFLETNPSEEVKMDFEKVVELENELERISSYLREVNLKTI
ncbi:hypothetical protein [Methanococcus aeolicus]|jgi:hypothetical protein|uniref:Uncharacterized protein n=1 Tax=Methanococcus aeolicus (strain ATCC BAA-1280 / DSM 17508 / OCM 812 / Nankai-3) TaxID=419665 RepID=A6UT44_META3|nr:hypothetical protein [Methanococcus aeolicus]ABR55666.1 conserved hypothetical protein [Methanococcus aeolicus Nankai-3]UXM85166.1 hypothetical protein N6C89_02495 [Methanococcus aeolicus]